ncbi:MAG: alpha/beta hydrolase-fold protein [Planctomycetota bacterium]
MGAFKSGCVVLLLSVLACLASHLEAAASRRQILVSPEVHSDGRVTFRLNAPNAKRVAPPDMRSIGNYEAFERDLIEDVIPYVQERYRVSRDQKDRAIAGLSMGGGQALTVGLGNPELFGWVGAFSSAVPRGQKLDNLLAKAKAGNEKLNLLWVGCGRKDFLYQANQKLIERLKSGNIKHLAHITEGGHEWRLWRRYLNELVPLLFRADK